MTTPEIKEASVPVVVNVGICRRQTCICYGKYGLLGDVCPGNTPYPLRNQIHRFEEIITFQERELCNRTDISDIIGCVFNHAPHRKPVIGILGGHVESADLGGHSFGNRKAGRIICSAVDLLARR